MVALTFERLWQEDLKLHANLGCILTPYLKQTTNNQNKQQPQMTQVLSQASDPLHGRQITVQANYNQWLL